MHASANPTYMAPNSVCDTAERGLPFGHRHIIAEKALVTKSPRKITTAQGARPVKVGKRTARSVSAAAAVPPRILNGLMSDCSPRRYVSVAPIQAAKATGTPRIHPPE